MDKEHLKSVFYSLVVIILVAGLVPYINMFKLSQISQYNIVKSAKQSISDGTLADTQKAKVKGACAYLMRTNEGEKLVNSLLSPEIKEKILNSKNDYYTSSSFIKYLYGNKELNSIDVSGYSKVYPIDEYVYTDGTNLLKFDQFEFNVGNNQKIKANILPIINKYKEQSENSFSKFFQENNEFTFNSNLKLILTHISLNYDKSLNEVVHCSFSGYLLEK